MIDEDLPAPPLPPILLTPSVPAEAAEALAQQEQMMAHIFDSQSDAFYTSGHMMDDGMIDPRNMRSTIGMLLETIREARGRTVRPNSFGVARL